MDKLTIDIDKVIDFVFNDPNETQTEIVEMYAPNEKNNMEMQQKQISENKNIQNETKINVRYDFIKNLFSLAFNSEDYSTMTIGEKTAFHGLLNYGFIKELENKETQENG